MFRNNEITHSNFGYSAPCPSKKGGAAWQRSGGGTSAKVFRPNMSVSPQSKGQIQPSEMEAAGKLSHARAKGVPEDGWAVPVYNGGYNSLHLSKRGGQPGKRSGGGASSDCFRPQMRRTDTESNASASVEYPKEPAGVSIPNSKPSRKAGAHVTVKF